MQWGCQSLLRLQPTWHAPVCRFPLLAIAPEATTKAQPCLLKFRRGAFSAGQPVCPVLLRYRYRHFNPGRWYGLHLMSTTWAHFRTGLPSQQFRGAPLAADLPAGVPARMQAGASASLPSMCTASWRRCACQGLQLTP